MPNRTFEETKLLRDCYRNKSIIATACDIVNGSATVILYRYEMLPHRFQNYLSSNLNLKPFNVVKSFLTISDSTVCPKSMEL